MPKLASNIKEVQKKLNQITKINQKATAAALRATAKIMQTESARSVRNAKYAKATVTEIKQHIKKSVIGTKRQKVEKQRAKIVIGGGDIPAHLMRLGQKMVSTRRGKRWAVVRRGRKRSGEADISKAFHLKSIGQKQLRQAGGEPFDKTSKLFTRASDGSLVQYKFRSYADVIRDSYEELPLRTYAGKVLAKQIERQLQRYTYAINAGLVE